MKKLYTLMLLAASATMVSVSANSLTLENQRISKGGGKQLNAFASNEFNAEIKPLNVVETVEASPVSLAPKSKIGAKSVAKETLIGDWTVSYTNSNGIPVTADATIIWAEQYSQLEITIPGTYSNLPIYADYDEETAVLTFSYEYWGSNGTYNVYMYPYTVSGNQASLKSSVTATYNEAEQTITFDEEGIYLGFWAAQGNSLLGTYWSGSDFSFTRPDGDYSLSINVEEECTPDNKFKFTVTAGEDIASIYLVPWEGDISAATFQSYYESYITILGQQVQADAVYTLSPESQMQDGSGYYTAMVFGLDANGNVRKSTQGTMFVVVNEDEVYQTIGTVAYNDVFVSEVYSNFTNNNAVVEIQEKIGAPGVYRLVDAYAGQRYIHDDGCPHYIYLDASDAEFVNLLTSPTGLDFNYGLLTLGSFGGALGYTKEQCQTNGYPSGSLNERKITFPVNSVLSHESKYNEPGSWSYTNQNNEMVIELPELVLNLTVLNQENEQPMAGVTVSVEGATATNVATYAESVGDDANVTDESGKLSLSLPSSIDYLDTITVTVTHMNGTKESADVKLNGANNDYTFYASEGSTGVENVAIDNAAPVEYFNLQGVRINKPLSGIIVIKRQGDKIEKELVK